MLSDEALLASATRDHDRGALADFFERHQLPVYRTCLGVLRRSDLAEDATQETFIAVMRQGGTVRPDGNVRGWLHRVAMNAALQLLRAERRRGRRELLAGRERIEAAGAGGTADLPAAIDPAILRTQILALAARWRIPILLRYEQGLSYQEIAGILRVSEGTVASRLHRGLAQLREALEPIGMVAENVDLEHAIGRLPPHRLSRELETSLRALAAGLPGSRLLRRPTPTVLVVCSLIVGAMVATVGWMLYAAWFMTPRPPTPAGGGGGTTTSGGAGVAPAQVDLKIQRAVDAYHQAFRARFRDATLNGLTHSLLAELNNPEVIADTHVDGPAVARLAAFLAECERRQPSYADMDWKDLEQQAFAMRNDPTVGKLAVMLTEWTQAEGRAAGQLAQAREFFRSNRHDEAFAAFQRIDDESVYHKEAAVGQMLELKTLITDRTVREANQKVRNGDYQSALDEINRVLNLFEGKYADVIVTLNPLLKECEKNLKYQNLVQEAEILITQKRFDEAEAGLAAIDLGAPPAILARVEKLRGSIDLQRTMAIANERYYAGDGKAALAILGNAVHPDLVKLRVKIQKVVDATTAAQVARAKNLLDEAKRHWGEVLGLEADEGNRYRQEARRLTEGSTYSADAEAADREFDLGFEAQQANQPDEARRHYEEAMRLFPNHEKSESAIKAFARDAQKQFNLDKVAFARGQMTLDVIIPKFENVLAFLRPTDAGVYTMYKEALDKLKTTGKF